MFYLQGRGGLEGKFWSAEENVVSVVLPGRRRALQAEKVTLLDAPAVVELRFEENCAEEERVGAAFARQFDLFLVAPVFFFEFDLFVAVYVAFRQRLPWGRLCAVGASEKALGCLQRPN